MQLQLYLLDGILKCKGLVLKVNPGYPKGTINLPTCWDCNPDA